jgi:hypothetical protein
MIITLRDFYGNEIDFDWQGPRENIPPLQFVRDNKIFFRQQNTTLWKQYAVDDLSGAKFTDLRLAADIEAAKAAAAQAATPAEVLPPAEASSTAKPPKSQWVDIE